MITYADFTAAFPLYLDPPYTQPLVEEKLLEATGAFPQIDDCIPEPYRLLATKYAINYLIQADKDNCYNGREVAEIKSLDDKIVFNVSKGNSHRLADNTWGARLIRLFEQYGCYVAVGQKNTSSCGGTCG
jgi:hypothetical protein